MGWIVPGYVFGGLNAVLGTAILVDGHDSDLGLGLGLGGLIVGVADLALATVATVKRSRHLQETAPVAPPPSYRISLAPQLGPDGVGGAAVGLSLRLTDW